MTDVVSAAESKLGDPYEWGATGPNAFDCSGLMQWAYGQAGIKIPRTSQEQRSAGEVISLSDAQPGDLVTYSYPGESGNPTPGNHVGMYIAPGTMIDAPTQGEDVKIQPIDMAHLDRVVHITGNTSVSSTSSADLSADGIDPSTWPGTVMGASFLTDPLGTVAGDASEAVVSSILKAIGPILLNGVTIAAAASLVVLGFWRMTAPARQKAQAEVGQAAQIGALAL